MNSRTRTVHKLEPAFSSERRHRSRLHRARRRLRRERDLRCSGWPSRRARHGERREPFAIHHVRLLRERALVAYTHATPPVESSAMLLQSTSGLTSLTIDPTRCSGPTIQAVGLSFPGCPAYVFIAVGQFPSNRPGRRSAMSRSGDRFNGGNYHYRYPIKTPFEGHQVQPLFKPHDEAVIRRRWPRTGESYLPRRSTASLLAASGRRGTSSDNGVDFPVPLATNVRMHFAWHTTPIPICKVRAAPVPGADRTTTKRL